MIAIPRRCLCSRRRPLSFTCSEYCELTSLIHSELSRSKSVPPDELEDLLKQVLLDLLRTGQLPDDLHGLAVTIARRRRIDHLRARVRQARCKPWCEHYAETPSRPLIDDSARDLGEAMRLMADDTRAVFKAIYIEESTLRQAAESLGRTLHEIRMLRNEAKCFLQRLWGIAM